MCSHLFPIPPSRSDTVALSNDAKLVKGQTAHSPNTKQPHLKQHRRCSPLPNRMHTLRTNISATRQSSTPVAQSQLLPIHPFLTRRVSVLFSSPGPHTPHHSFLSPQLCHTPPQPLSSHADTWLQKAEGPSRKIHGFPTGHNIMGPWETQLRVYIMTLSIAT